MVEVHAICIHTEKCKTYIHMEEIISHEQEINHPEMSLQCHFRNQTTGKFMYKKKDTVLK